MWDIGCGRWKIGDGRTSDRVEERGKTCRRFTDGIVREASAVDPYGFQPAATLGNERCTEVGLA